MNYFLHTLRYLWPYRGRLAVAVGCVLFIMVLWGGGLGMLLPGLKILIDDEGLHGWAWTSMIQDRLGARLVPRNLSQPLYVDKQDGQQAQRVTSVIDVVKVGDKGGAAVAGLKTGALLLGIDDGNAAHRLMTAPALSRYLAFVSGGPPVRLRVYYDEQVRTTEVALSPPGFGPRLLGRIAQAIPEPRTRLERFPMLAWLLVIALAMNCVRDMLRFVQEYLVETAALRGIMDLRCEIYNVALRLPLTFFSQKGTTDTQSRFIQDTNEVLEGHTTLFGKTLVEPAKAVASVGIAMALSWKLTLIAMVGGPPAFWLIRRLGKRMRKASQRALESWSAILGVLEETLIGIRVVKAYTMEAAERKRFFQANRQLLKQRARMAMIDAATAPAVEALGMTAGTCAAGLAGYWVLSDQMDPMVFMTWMGCLAAMFDPVRKLAKVVTRFQRADAAAARIFELRSQEQEKFVPNAPPLPRHSRDIEFRNVCFRYPGAAEDAVKNANLAIRAGETIALVGPNGSGKTTLVSMLPRLLDPTSGAVFIDGQNVAGVSLRSLRRQIGLVTQDAVMFHATIRENISYGLRRAKDAQVLAASRRAFVDEFVVEMPQGYDTLVGEHGATLSGGQKQRIAIARAILRDPAILIFDEAMSQVDSDSERRIHEAMVEFSKGRTTLLIAHRFATVLSADRIVVLDAGRIVDIGPHAELLDRCPIYRHLYQTQFVDSGGTGRE